MKDIIISKARCKIETVTLLVCCFIAWLFNLGAVIYYNSSAIELITSLGYVLIFAVALYILWTLIRLIVYAIKIMFIKKK